MQIRAPRVDMDGFWSILEPRPTRAGDRIWQGVTEPPASGFGPEPNAKPPTANSKQQTATKAFSANAWFLKGEGCARGDARTSVKAGAVGFSALDVSAPSCPQGSPVRPRNDNQLVNHSQSTA